MEIKYENSPPPSDFEFDDLDTPLFFAYPRPQCVVAPPFIKVDYSLIHPSLLGYLIEKNSVKCEVNETSQDIAVDNINTNVSENLMEIEEVNSTENEKTILITVEDQNTTNNNLHKENNTCEETENSSKGKDESTVVFQKGEHVPVSHRKHTRKHHKRIHSKRKKSIQDSAFETIFNSNETECFGIESISTKKSKAAAKDLNCGKPTKYIKSKYSKRVVTSDDDQSSDSDKSKASDFYSRKSKECKNIPSDDEQSLSHKSKASLHTSHKERGLRISDVKVKLEVFSDEDISFREGAIRENFSNDEDSLDNTSYNRSNRKKYVERRLESHSPKAKVKHEPMECEDSKNYHGPDVYYCSYCKLSLNSELTWQSHLLGKRHKRAIRAQSVSEVAKTSLIPATYIPIPEEGNRHDKPPPGIERKELRHAISSIQDICDGLRDRQAVGLRHIWEIRGEAETVYYCYLCDAPCAASSVMLHITGYKHRLQCLKEYFPQVYGRFKDAHKRKIERVMDDKFLNHERVFQREKIRVFKDIPTSDYRSSSSYLIDQPGTSWQGTSRIKQETVTIKDENGKSVIPSNQEYLETKFADFHCTLCDSHMNNIQMWESHVRGKRHLKNLKKPPQGVAATNKYIEAPSGTVSNVERQIEDVCSYNDIIIGLNYIRENQGKQGNQYNCFPCGGCCSDIDIVDHIISMKHKIKILEKMHFDGFENSIMEINSIQISTYYREAMVDEECLRIVNKYGRGKPQVYYIKRDLRDYGML